MVENYLMKRQLDEKRGEEENGDDADDGDEI